MVVVPGGIEIFVSRDFIESEANNVLSGDKLTITCRIIYKDEIKMAKELRGYEANRKKLIADYEKLVNDEEFSDVEFIIENLSLRAHKNILSKRSSVFAAMFQTEMREKNENKVEITDVRYEVFLEMLRFIYAGKVRGIEAVNDELLAVADKYSLDGLKAMCEKSLSCHMNVDNAVDNLRLADLHCADILKSESIKFIVGHATDIVNEPKFRQLPSNVISDVLSAVVNQKNVFFFYCKVLYAVIYST